MSFCFWVLLKRDNNMKRITIFDGTLEKGGAERVISILTNKMINRGINVEILLFYNRKIHYQINEKIKITTIEGETGTTNPIKNLFWMRKYLKNNTGCLVSFLAPFNIFALVASFALKIPVVVADRNDPRKVPEKFIIRKLRDFLYVFADKIVVQTTYNRDYFSRLLKRKTVIIHNPVDLRESTSMALNIEKKMKIVSVGRLMKQKNQKLLINSFFKVHQKYPEYSLFLYGEGPERDSLELLIKEKNLEDSVFLKGQVDNIFEEIADSKVFVLSSNYEGMPNALIEAMCLGLPVISTNVSGASDLIENNINGIIIDVNSEEQLTNAMFKMLEDTQFRNDCASNAVSIAKRLDSDVICNQWIKTIGEVYEY